MSETAPSSPAGWPARTSMSQAWPTRHSVFRSSRRRHRGCRSSASPQAQCSTGLPTRWAASALLVMPRRWQRTSWPSGAATMTQCGWRRAHTRFNSAGTAAWKPCSAAFTLQHSNGATNVSSARRGSRRSPPNRVDAPYSSLEQLEPGIARVLAHNPSAFTYYGTQTYLIGEAEVAVIDPGPDLPEHLEALEQAIAGRPVAAIMCTHTHRDHSPASRPLARATGAPIIGCAALALETVGPRADAAFDGDYEPDLALSDGDEVEVAGKRVIAVATPGHTSNHLCFAYEGALLTGDHVMGWSTTVVVP